MPAQNAALAHFNEAPGARPPRKSVVLSTDYDSYEVADLSFPASHSAQSGWDILHTTSVYPSRVTSLQEARLFFEHTVGRVSEPFVFASELSRPWRALGGVAAFDRLILEEPAKRPPAAQIQLLEDSELRLAQSIASRLAELRNARLEEEGEDIRSEPLSEFVSFVANHPKLRLPDIVLSPEGNIIAEWEKGKGRLFSVHFLGNGQARVVIFVPDPSDERSTLRASSLALVGSVLLLAQNYSVQWWVLEE